MAGKKRNGAPMSKKMLNSRRERLLGKCIKEIPKEKIQEPKTVKIDRYYLVERDNGIQVQQKNDK